MRLINPTLADTLILGVDCCLKLIKFILESILPPVATPCQLEPTVCYIFATKSFCKNLKSLWNRWLAVGDWHVANVNVVSSSLITRFFKELAAYVASSCHILSTLDILKAYSSVILNKTFAASCLHQPSLLPVVDRNCPKEQKVCYIFATQPLFCQIFLWVFWARFFVGA